MQLTSVFIPNGVTEIGFRAFYENPLTSIIIGANVELGGSAFDYFFERFYDAQGKKAGTYILRVREWSLQ